MSFDRLNDWLTLIANLGVIGGLVFVGLEVRQNTLAMERQIRVEFADNTHGRIAESNELVSIVAKVVEGQGVPNFLQKLNEEFGLTHEETQRWWRYIYLVMLRDEADWLYNEEEGCPNLAFRLQFLDQQIVFDAMKHTFDPGFVMCVEAKRT